jgi:hypothetical protein
MTNCKCIARRAVDRIYVWLSILKDEIVSNHWIILSLSQRDNKDSKVLKVVSEPQPKLEIEY